MYLIILLLVTLTYFAVDIYLPALITIAEYYQVTENITQVSITMYMLGLTASQISYGIMSDKYGRKPCLQLGISLNLIALVMIIFAPNIYILNAARLLQGLGLGCCVTVPRAMLSDFLKGTNTKRLLGSLSR